MCKLEIHSALRTPEKNTGYKNGGSGIRTHVGRIAPI